MTLLLLLACTGPAVDTGTGATIALISPVDGATVCGTPLEVSVDVTGIVLVDPYVEDPDPDPGTGHVDVMLNGQDAVMTGTEHATVEAVEPGEWQLKVELSNADHTPVEPYAGAFVYITVDPAVCG